MSSNFDLCASCGWGGNLICCDTCPQSFHLGCAAVAVVPIGTWRCPSCLNSNGEMARVMHKVTSSLVQSNSCIGVFEAATCVHSGISLLNIFQFLELWTLHEIFAKVVHASVSLLHVPGGSARLEPLTGWELGTVLLLKYIANEIGGDEILNAIEALEGPQSAQHFSLASGFGASFLKCSRNETVPCPRHEDVCTSCGKLRYLRSACLSCGAPHLLECNLMRVNAVFPIANCLQPDTTIEDARLNAISAGISYIASCGVERNTFTKFGGDIIFLVRNLVHTVGLTGHKSRPNTKKRELTHRSNLQMGLAAADCFIDLVQRWMDDHVQGSYEMEMEEILNIVEALHAIEQLGIDTASSIPPATEILARLTTIEHPIVTNATTFEKDEDLKEQRTRACHRFSIADIKRRLREAILQFDVTDMLGYDPTKHQVPLTDTRHCAHCGKINSRGVPNCADCNAFLRSRVDYGSLTDALVWSHLFEELGVPLICNNANVSFVDVASVLPLVRVYQRIDELGHDFFRLQCYFVTHFIYVMSDWGRHMLQRSLFEEELVFMVSNLHQVISMKDPELTGEFVQCLRILGISHLDSSIWPSIKNAMIFLLELEKYGSCESMWFNHADSAYDRYHTAYCAAIGLMSYSFLPSSTTKMVARYPLPRAFQVRTLK
mmetsp:Transcript_3775/g.11170  ORF Transcript_3775/g.11170 Transcript_3775/m.11170 type:complete len:661 (-) Transcript_3775:184-2166(-)